MVKYKEPGGKVELKLINPLVFIDYSEFFIAFSSFSNPTLLVKQVSNKKKFIITHSELGFSVLENRIVLLNLDKISQEAFIEIFQEILNTPRN